MPRFLYSTVDDFSSTASSNTALKTMSPLIQSSFVRFMHIPFFLGGWLMILGAVDAQIRPPNYEESAVPKYTLEDVLAGPDGKPIEQASQWSSQRQFLLGLFAEQEYGTFPKEPVHIETKLVEEGQYKRPSGIPSQVRRRQFLVTLSRNGQRVPIQFVVWSPLNSNKKHPCFLGLNFRGNQSTMDDPSLFITTSWCDARHPGVVNNRATEASRASHSDRWPIEAIVERGYAVATAHYCDIDPDFDDGFENGVHALFPEHRCSEAAPDRWGSIGAWAWGLSRLTDVLVKTDGIDPDGLIVLGHSRLGKTALWAGANDERFKIVISNNSGCGGAALSKRCYGESVAAINRSFPHWFNRNFRKFNDAEDQLTFDQHQLIASIAPRPVYIASAIKDRWADPLGELLSGHHASPAFALLGKKGLDLHELPKTDTSFGDSIGYHLRDGEHDLTPLDWTLFMDFAKRHGL